MGNKFNRQNRERSFRQSNGQEQVDDPNSKLDDPRVRAFVRDYTPVIDQDDPDAIIFNLSGLRQMFNAYPTANGFDPLKMILNQLDNNNFQLQANWYKEELILPVKKVMVITNQAARGLPMPNNN